MKDKILVTGAAGFIGFHLAESLLKDNFNVCGIDNINDYYDVKLKNDRIDILKKYSNFNFNQVDISNFESTSNIFKNFQPDKVVNLAAQAGVRYSIDHPFAYLNSNIVGFLNIIELCKTQNIKGLIYASSSSVYGGNKEIPFSVSDRVNKPLSLYAASKRSNELIAYSYSNLFNLHTTGLRFFTVYGPWGRPDMAMYKFANKICSGESIDVYNNGDMKRDFTYIDDIVSGIKSSIDKNYQCEVFNLGNNKSENLMDIVKYIEQYLDKKADINFLPMQPGDVKESWAEIKKSMKMLNYKPKTDVDVGIEKFIDWYKKYNIK
ncbi:MAG: protein CapI [Candidatus Marinimicrobia bacterium]|nr:protein CapI [Candidatus Neomarinimicrobiota bacterium]|tara:strand:+ start:33929 stop:34888 length:960 start_codon:yes stop_codon:yes gene_type:complete